MLQWMGGSRRKVTTTRKSTQKRQKQYFEQRRRQQQQGQAAGAEGYDGGGGGNVWGRNQKEYRSLDVLSLVNLSSTKPPNSSSNDSALQGEGKPKNNTATVEYCIAKDPVMFPGNTVARADSIEFKEERTQSSYQVDTVSPNPNKVFISPPDNHSNVISGSANKADPWKTETEQNLSLFDLIGDDELNGDTEGNCMHEAHMAFSIEGLGKLGSETPVRSPQPGRYVSYGCSSPAKSARQLKSSNNFNHVLDDFGSEMDGLMQDLQTPLGNSLEFSTVINNSYSNLKTSFPAVRDRMQLDGHSHKTKSLFCGRKTLFDTGNDNEDLWEARSSWFDSNCLDERKSAMSWNNWPCGMDGNSADYLKYGTDEIPDYAFEDSHIPKKRDALEAMERYSVLDSHAAKRRASVDDYDFIIAKGARHHSAGKDFNFKDVTCQPDWSCFFPEDTRDNLSSLSEESSSSTAVRGEASSVSPSYSKSRHYRRLYNSFDSPEIKHGAKNIAPKRKLCKNWDDSQKGSSTCVSENNSWIPRLSESKSAHYLNSPFKEKTGTCETQLFEEGCRSAYVTSGLTSAFQTSEAKRSSSDSKPWTKDIFAPWNPEQHIDPKFSFARSKHDTNAKYSPSGSFMPENFEFCYPSSCIHSPTFSKVEFGSTTPEFSADSPDFELEKRVPDSSHTAISHEEISIPVPAQKSETEDNKDNSKFKQANYEKVEIQSKILAWKAVDALDSQENGSEYKEAKDENLETSSSVKIPDISESSVDKKEYQRDTEVTPHQNGNKELKHEKSGRRKTVSKRPSYCLDSSPRVMMLQSYFFQLLCVQW